ncbi:MAG TPA: glycosyltransferase [Thermoanaerobaculia bacterium]|nr:glycosyltransferase [Thermoanaerobaculia bacterium]
MGIAVIVLGMHRSGTSALAGALHHLGVSFGGPLLPPGPDNERGFWELREVVEIHDELLAALGASHLDLAPLPADWRERPEARAARERLAGVLRREFADVPLWGVKDPRLSVLLPLWEELLDDLGVERRFALVFRSPWEVVRSLAVRSAVPTREALALWERHVSEAERLTRGRPRAFSSLDRLLEDGVAELSRLSAALELSFPVSPEDARGVLMSFLSPSGRHWRRPPPPEDAGEALAAAAEEVAAVARRLVDEGESPEALEAFSEACTALRAIAAPTPPARQVLFLSHGATRTGAPLMLLRLATWLKSHGCVEPRFVLRDEGPLEAEFRAVGDTVVTTESLFDPAFCDSVSLVWANTATNGSFLARLGHDELPVISHVHELSYALSAFGRELFREQARRTSRFVACSEAVRSNLVENEGIPAEKVVVFHEAVDTAALAARSTPEHARALKAELGLTPETRIVVGAGTADWRKGTDLFIQVGHVLTARRPDVAFAWVGGTSSSIEELRLNHDLAKLGHPPRIFFLGERVDPLPVIDAADLFLLTSREDPFPLVLLEAAALGKPALCFDRAGGAPEFCREAGRVVPYLDLPAMEREIEALLDDESVRAALGEEARRHVCERYDLALLGARVSALVEELALASPVKSRAQVEPLGPLPDSAFQLTWLHSKIPGRVAAGEVVPVLVTIKNAGTHVWPNRASTGADGRYAIRLGYWWEREGRMIGSKGNRIDLPRRLSPGESITLVARVITPVIPGSYDLQLDLLQELVAWFGEKGTPHLASRVDVIGWERTRQNGCG